MTVIATSAKPIVKRVSGPIVTVSGMRGARMYEVVLVGEGGLIGEIVRVQGDLATVQVYENTTGLEPGDAVERTGAPLSVSLGPGLVGNIYDGIQRPLEAIAERSGAWIGRGAKPEPLDIERRWPFDPDLKEGDDVTGGAVLGDVNETRLVCHQVLVPPDVSGRVRWIAEAGEYTVADTICVLETPEGERELTMVQRWPVREPRPVRKRRRPTEPLVTGQRIIDALFPIAKGGTAAIPGGFGTGKTMTQHQLAKWSDAQVIVYVGCGERGNEMTDVMQEFPELVDPWAGRPLMERTILIANTSNMPVAAREVSIYTGITLAEYYRDQGLDVAVFADSTSRWAEALREMAARLEEMPAEEGFPATLATRLAQFYERGGAVETLADRPASVSIVGAVSPPGSDFSEPVTQHTRRFTRCFWALDTELANARHYPSIHWLRSYSEYVEDVTGWWERRAPDWSELRKEAMAVLQREERLQQIVKLVGPDVLPDMQRLVLLVAEVLRDGYLAQSAFEPKDMYAAPDRQVELLRIILMLYRRGRQLIEAGAPLARIRQLPSLPRLRRAKNVYGNDEVDELRVFGAKLGEELDALQSEYGKEAPRGGRGEETR